MRILVLAPNYPSVQNKYPYAFIHARNKIYKKYGHSVAVGIPSDTFRKYDYEGITVIRAPLQAIVQYVNIFDPDFIAIHVPCASLVNSLKASRRPIIVWIHGAEILIGAFHHYIPPFGIRNALRKLQDIPLDSLRDLRLRKSLMSVNAIVYVSNWMRRVSERYLLMKHPNSFVIPNPVDIELFKPMFPHKLYSEIFDLVSVRSLEWKYGLDIAIKAIGGEKSIHLRVVGKGSLEKYLENLAKICHSNVTFITEGIEHDRLPEFYNRSMAFIAPSRTEAQGVAMCEAMACGLPVVATKIGGIPEFVKDHFNGLLAPPENPSKLRTAIKILTSKSDLYDLLSQNAVDFVRENLSHRRIYQKEHEVFEYVLRG